MEVAFFTKVTTSVHNFTPCLSDELHVILKYMNLEICEHSSFLIIEEIVFEIKFEVPTFQNHCIFTIIYLLHQLRFLNISN